MTRPSDVRRDDGPEAIDVDVAEGSTAVQSLLSDTALIIGITRGRREALAEIYERHGTHAQRLARQVCGADRADDVVQQVFLRLWQTPAAFDVERGSLRSYLMRMTRGRALDLLRSDSCPRNSEHDVRPARTPQEENDPSTTVGTRLGHDAEEMLGRLPVSQREAIALCLRGYTYREVAQALGQPEGAIKGRIRAGLVRLHSRTTEDAP